MVIDSGAAETVIPHSLVEQYPVRETEASRNGLNYASATGDPIPHAICLFAYGSMGMGVAAAISSIVVLLHFTLNIFLASKKFDFNVIIKSPSFYAILITILLLF